MRESEMFAARAQSAHQDADAATLDNVRSRALRSEQAWQALADRSVRVETARTTREASVASARAAIDDEDVEDV